MRKITLFDRLPDPWPEPKVLEPYFLGGKGRRWVFESDTDQAALVAEGAGGTEHLERNEGRVDIDLFLVGHPAIGIQLTHRRIKRWGRGTEAFSSISDRGRLDRYYRDRYGSLIAVGLFIPFEDAWRAVKEFLETDGALPKSIEWIAGRDLPPDAFPDTSPPVQRNYLSRVVLEYRPGPS
jgi:hypothetical protein